MYVSLWSRVKASSFAFDCKKHIAELRNGKVRKLDLIAVNGVESATGKRPGMERKKPVRRERLET